MKHSPYWQQKRKNRKTENESYPFDGIFCHTNVETPVNAARSRASSNDSDRLLLYQRKRKNPYSVSPELFRYRIQVLLSVKYAADGMKKKSKDAADGFYSGSSLVMGTQRVPILVTRRKETDDIRNGQGSDFDFFLFAVLCFASSVILLLRHTGSSRGCSPLQPPAGCKAPCTRFRVPRLAITAFHDSVLHFFFYAKGAAASATAPLKESYLLPKKYFFALL